MFVLFMLQVSVIEVTLDAEPSIFKEHAQRTLRNCEYEYNSSVTFAYPHSVSKVYLIFTTFREFPREIGCHILTFILSPGFGLDIGFIDHFTSYNS
jgi:hypothetical protein